MRLLEWIFGKKEEVIEAKPWPYKLRVSIDNIKYDYRETRKFKDRVRGKNHEIRLCDEEFRELCKDVVEYYTSRGHRISSTSTCRDGSIDLTLHSVEIVPFYDSEFVGSWY